jgi:SAM-dependent methyltransferase
MTSSAPLDAESFKSATREQWNRTAHGWNEQTRQVREWLTEATATMLDLAEVRPGARVLDVAAGAGDQTLDIARRVGPGGSVLATDLSPVILGFAARNARNAGLANVETLALDGERLAVDPASFDAAVCRLGLMFFPDPLAGLVGMRDALKPGGRVCVMVLAEPATNPCVGIVVSTALKHAGLAPRDPYQPGSLLSLGRPGLLQELLAKAGFADATTTRLSAPFRLPAAKDYVEFIRTSAGPILQLLAHLDETARAAAWAEIEERLGSFQTRDGWVGPNELLLGAGTR